MSETRDSCIFYRSFYEAIEGLPSNSQLVVYKSIFSYSLNFIEPELKGLEKSMWILIKPQLDANIKRFRNGSKPKTASKTAAKPALVDKIQANEKQNGSKTEASTEQKESKAVTNNNNNVNNNKNENENTNPVPSISPSPDFDLFKENAIKGINTRQPYMDKSEEDESWKQLFDYLIKTLEQQKEKADDPTIRNLFFLYFESLDGIDKVNFTIPYLVKHFNRISSGFAKKAKEKRAIRR